MSGRRVAALILLVAAVAAACERSPVEPVDAADEFALAVLGPAPVMVRPAPFTLPGLLHAAVHTVYSEQGADAARALVAELNRLHEPARGAAQSTAAEADAERLQAVHREQLRIVLTVFGSETPKRVIAGARADARRMAGYADQLQAAGKNISAVDWRLAQAAALLTNAEVALAQGAVRTALDYGTRGAALLEAAQFALAETLRVSGVDELFAAASDLMRQRGGDAAVRTALSEYHRLQLTAEAVVRAGDRVRAHSAVQAVRDEQIRIILNVIGPEAAARMLEQARAATLELQAGLTAARTGGSDVIKLERMHAVARDLLSRAATSLAADDARAALDLGGHAVTLLNGLRLALATHLSARLPVNR